MDPVRRTTRVFRAKHSVDDRAVVVAMRTIANRFEERYVSNR